MSRTVSTSVELPASPEEVWEVIMDPHRLGEWVTTHEGLENGAPSRLEQGSTFRQRLKVAGPAFTVSWEVTECDRPSHVRWIGRGPGGSEAHVAYDLESADGGTRFTYENRFELPGGALGRVAGRAVGERVARREAEATLENLARVVGE